MLGPLGGTQTNPSLAKCAPHLCGGGAVRLDCVGMFRPPPDEHADSSDTHCLAASTGDKTELALSPGRFPLMTRGGGGARYERARAHSADLLRTRDGSTQRPRARRAFIIVVAAGRVLNN